MSNLDYSSTAEYMLRWPYQDDGFGNQVPHFDSSQVWYYIKDIPFTELK